MLQGGNVEPLVVGITSLSGSGIDVNVTVVQPGNDKVAGSFKLQLYDDANTATASIAYNEGALGLQNKIIQDLGLNVSVALLSENAGTGAITWLISYIEKYTYESSNPYIKIHSLGNLITGTNAMITVDVYQNASYTPLSGNFILQLSGNNIEKSSPLNYNVSANELKKEIERSFAGAKKTCKYLARN